MFTINTSDATMLTPVTPPQTTGHFPVSVAVNAMYACVLSIGYNGSISCFTYNSSNLTFLFYFDLSAYTYGNNWYDMWNTRSGEILFLASNLSLIVTINNLQYPLQMQSNIILLFWFNGGLVPASNNILNSSAVPLSVTLVGTNGLFITTPSGVQFMTYQLTNGIVYTNPSTYLPLPYTVSYPTFSRTIGSYFAISSGSGIVQMNVNISGTSPDPFSIVPYYDQLCDDSPPLGATIVTASNTDYMFVMDSGPNFISSYQLQVGNSPIAYCYVATQANSTVLSRVRSIAAYIQSSGVSSAAIRLIFSYMIFVLIFSMHLF
jgi:hypothetical protein